MKRKKDELTDRVASLRRSVESVAASADALEVNINQHQNMDELFRVIVGALTDAIFLTLKNGDLTWASPNAPTFFNTSPHDFPEHKNIFKLLNTHSHLLTDTAEMQENGELKDQEIEYKDNAGQIRYFSVNIKRVSIHNGEYLFIIRDITAAKLMENNLRETDQSLSEMIYIASHDLQSPLISLEGYADELLENHAGQLDEPGKHCLKRLKVNSSRMHQLVISLLEISRLNTRPYPYETFDPAHSITEMASELRRTLGKVDTVIAIEPLPPLRGDRQRLEGVFQRLLSNALLYGGQNIVIGHNGSAWFIKDDGAGIPPDQTENVFSPGARLKQVEAEGVGMGLTYCRKVIRKHGGKIWIESGGPRQGTTVFFTIPT